jgi:hypothetical protein
MAAADWLRAWDSQGPHRTGTEGDEAGAAWLAHQAAVLGAEVTSEAFAFDRIEPVDVRLELEGVRIDGVPVFDAPPTGPQGISGTLGPAGSNAAIGVAELSPHAVYSGEYQALRRSTSHHALVIVCRGANPGMALLNAESFRAPYGAPAIHVASEAREVVLTAIERGNGAGHRRLPPQAGDCAQHCRHHGRSRQRAAAGGGNDTSQLLVAINRGARRRYRVLARGAARSDRDTTCNGRDTDCQ